MSTKLKGAATKPTQSSNTKPGATDNKPSPDENVYSSLQPDVPSTQNYSSPKKTNDAPKERKINNANDLFLFLLEKSEETRLKRQMPVLTAVLVFVGIQLVAFNGFIGWLLYVCATNFEAALVSPLMDFLKYYIGAVIVEMIGMIVFITKSTFTSYAKDLIKTLAEKNKNENEKLEKDNTDD